MPDSRAVATVAGFTLAEGPPGSPAVLLEDDFSGTSIDTSTWTVTATYGATVSEDGQLQVDTTASSGNVAPKQGSVESSAVFDLTEGYAQVRVAAVPTETAGWPLPYLWLTLGGASATIAGGNLTPSGEPYDATSMAFIRIRGHDGQAVCEVSPDGGAWSPAGSFGAVDLSAVQVALGMSAGSGQYGYAPAATGAFADLTVAQVPPGPMLPSVSAEAVVIAPDGSATVHSVTAQLGYSDYVNEAVIEAVRAAVGDPQLEVTIA